MKCPNCNGEYKSLPKHYAHSNCKHPKLSDEQKDIAIGLLMGDGYIRQDTHRSNCALQVNMITREFIYHLEEVFNQVPNNIRKKRFDKEKVNDQWEIVISSHPYFNELKSWYSGDGKSFPEDLELNRTILKYWYVCDGSLKRRKNRNPVVTISCTNEKDRPDYLNKLFDMISGDVSIYKGDIRLTVNQTKEFFNYIGSESLPGFDYKWENVDNFSSNKKLDRSEVVEIKKDLRDTNKSHRQIAKEFSVYHSTIGRIDREEYWEYVEID